MRVARLALLALPVFISIALLPRAYFEFSLPTWGFAALHPRLYAAVRSADS